MEPIKKLRIKQTRFFLFNRSLSVIIILIPFVLNGSATESFGWIFGTAVVIISLLISRFESKILERIDEYQIAIYYNFFGIKLYENTYYIDAIASVNVRQDEKNYYIIEFLMRDKAVIRLGKFAIRNKLTPFERDVCELIRL